MCSLLVRVTGLSPKIYHTFIKPAPPVNSLFLFVFKKKSKNSRLEHKLEKHKDGDPFAAANASMAALQADMFGKKKKKGFGF